MEAHLTNAETQHCFTMTNRESQCDPDEEVQLLQLQVQELEQQEQERVSELEQYLDLIQKLKKQLSKALDKNNKLKLQRKELVDTATGETITSASVNC